MKIQKAVEKLNNRLYGPLNNYNIFSCFTYVTSGTWDIIKFHHLNTGTEIILYNSENSDRKNNESLEKYVLKKFNKILKDLTSILTFINNKQ